MSIHDAEENTFKILIATDNHVGYMEKDPIRGKDSFLAFEEILKLAIARKVDFILLGGDLFHENQPSQSSLYQTMKLIRQYCFGDRESKVWIASDQSVNFSGFGKANYLDENLNISMPIFSIHGNHDDPSGAGKVCPLNLLSVAGMINYFGQSNSISDVTINPILLKKGSSKLALYGLGNIREERLHRQWRSGRVKFTRPEDDGTWDSWKNCFNMFVFHQNRAAHGPTSHIPPEFLDQFLDLIFWGHEHECRIFPEQYENFSITQPGSSVATSLSDGEAEPKHIGILTIEGSNYSLEKVRLKTVRPLQFTSVVLSQVPSLKPSDKKATQIYLEGVIESLIERAKTEWEEQQQEETGIEPCLDMPVPLVRIRVDYTGGYETFNPLQFGRTFNNRVANPNDMLKFQKAKVQRQKPLKPSEMLKDLTMAIPERLDSLKLEDLVNELLKKDLFILPESKLEEAVITLVKKNDQTSISRFVGNIIGETRNNLKNLPQDIEDLTLDYIKRKSSEVKESQNIKSAHSPLVNRTINHAVSPTLLTQCNTNNDNQNNNNNHDTLVLSSSEDQDSSQEDETPIRKPKKTPIRGNPRGRGRGTKRAASPVDLPSTSSLQRRRLPF